MYVDVWSAGCVLAELLLGQPIFPGDSGVDQLVEIIKVLGTPTREQIREMNPNYTEFKFPQIKAHPWQKVITIFWAVHLLSRALAVTIFVISLYKEWGTGPKFRVNDHVFKMHYQCAFLINQHNAVLPPFTKKILKKDSRRSSRSVVRKGTPRKGLTQLNINLSQLLNNRIWNKSG